MPLLRANAAMQRDDVLGEPGELPDVNRLRARFAPDPACLPNVVVHLASLTAYEALLGSSLTGGYEP